MKKLSLLLIFAMILSVLSACGGPAEELPTTGVQIELETDTVDINYINQPMTGNGWALYDRSYTENGSPAFTIGSASPNKFADAVVMMITASEKTGEIKYTVTNIFADKGTEKDIEIPASGFILVSAYSSKDKDTPALISEEFKLRKPLQMVNYESFQALLTIEKEADGSIEETEDEAINALRTISLLNPTIIRDDSAIIIYNSTMNGKIAENKDTYGVHVKASEKTNQYTVTELLALDTDKSSVSIAEDEYLLLFKGNYNVKYAQAHYTNGETVKIRYIDNLPSISVNPAIMTSDGTVYEVNTDNINNYTRGNDAICVYTNDSNTRTTPAGGDFIDLRCVGGIVIEVCDPGQNCTIPANGFVVSLTGDKKAIADNVTKGDFITLNKITATVIPEKYVRINNDTLLAIDGVDVDRSVEGMACIYTPARGETTNTNIYGYEITVQNNRVIALDNALGNQPIPADGFILSVHTSNAQIATIYSTLQIGDSVEFIDEPYEYNIAIYNVTVVNPTEVRSDTDVAVYNSEGTLKSTGTRASGVELTIQGGTVTTVSKMGNSPVPATGYLVSIGKTALADSGISKGLFKAGATAKYDSNSKTVVVMLSAG